MGLRISLWDDAGSSDAGGPSIRSGWIVAVERLIFVGVLGILCWMAWLWTHERPVSAFYEHGLMEDTQVAILVVCAIVLVPSMRLGQEITRTISTIFMIAMITGIIREAEVKSFNGPDWWNWLTHEFSLQEILLIMGALVLLVYTWSRRIHFIAIVRRSLHPYAIPLQLGAVLLFIGAYATEKLIRYGDFSKIAEELLETAGYLLILVGILRTLDKALSERLVACRAKIDT
jgi:hypothetical protein